MNEVSKFACDVTAGLLSYMTKEQWRALSALPDAVMDNRHHAGAVCSNCTLNISITGFTYADASAEHGISYYCSSCKEKNIQGDTAITQIRTIANRDLQCILYLLNNVDVTPMDFNTEVKPSLSQHDYEPFTADAWESECKLLDPKLCEEKKEVKKRRNISMYRWLTGPESVNKYVHINLYPTQDGKQKSRLYHIMHTERRNEWQLMFQREHQDESSSTLLLLFRSLIKQLATNFHCDWMQAENIALALLLSSPASNDQQLNKEEEDSNNSSDTETLESLGREASEPVKGREESSETVKGRGEASETVKARRRGRQALEEGSEGGRETFKPRGEVSETVKGRGKGRAVKGQGRAREASCVTTCDAMTMDSEVNGDDGMQGIEAEEDPLQMPLAEWYFIAPSCIDSWMEKLRLLGKTLEDCPGKTPQSIAKFKEWFREFQAVHGEQKVFTLHQCHGQKMVVAPGWGHAVVNLRPNVKLAWDHCLSQNLHIYITSWKRHAHYSGLKVRGDYAILEHHIVLMARLAYDKLVHFRFPGLIGNGELVSS